MRNQNVQYVQYEQGFYQYVRFQYSASYCTYWFTLESRTAPPSTEPGEPVLHQYKKCTSTVLVPPVQYWLILVSRVELVYKVANIISFWPGAGIL
jgi:hypothetical protein